MVNRLIDPVGIVMYQGTVNSTGNFMKARSFCVHTKQIKKLHFSKIVQMDGIRFEVRIEEVENLAFHSTVEDGLHQKTNHYVENLTDSNIYGPHDLDKKHVF